MRDLGNYEVGALVDFMWATNEQDGDSANPTTAGSLRVYKDNSATQRTSANGITDTRGFDSLAGVHHCRIDLADDTDAGFYEAGATYHVVLAGAVIDTKTVNTVLARFGIETGDMAVVLEAFESLAQQVEDVWKAAKTDMTVEGSIGKHVADKLDLMQTLTVAERAALADKLLGRNQEGGADGGRTVSRALSRLDNRQTLGGSAGDATRLFTLYKNDGTTVLFQANVTFDSGGAITAFAPTS
jgi:hypothetical protein